MKDQMESVAVVVDKVFGRVVFIGSVGDVSVWVSERPWFDHIVHMYVVGHSYDKHTVTYVPRVHQV